MDVLSYNGHIVISICPGLFMIEAKGMEKLMFNNANVITVCTNGEDLPAAFYPPNIRETSKTENVLFRFIRSNNLS